MKNLYLEKYISSLYKDGLPEFFKKRIQTVLTELESETISKRSPDVPSILNDLGVRKAYDLTDIFNTLCEIFDLPMYDLSKIKQEIKTLSLDELGIYLNTFLLITGDYDSILDSVKEQVSDNNNDFTSYSSCVYVASYLLAEKDSLGIKLFETAQLLNDSPVEDIVCQLRLCTYYVKRLDNPEYANKEFIKLREKILSLDNLQQKDVYFSLYVNLNCLYLLKQSINYDIIESLLNSALLLVDSAIDSKALSPLVTDQAYRYRSQININLAQVYLLNKKPKKARTCLKENLVVVSKHSEDYIGEATGTLAHVYYLNQNYNEAIDYSKQSLEFFSRIGNYSAWDLSKNILTASLHKANNENDAKYFYKLTIRDMVMGVSHECLDD